MTKVFLLIHFSQLAVISAQNDTKRKEMQVMVELFQKAGFDFINPTWLYTFLKPITTLAVIKAITKPDRSCKY